jgi:pyruvate dehydrogenase E1 component
MAITDTYMATLHSSFQCPRFSLVVAAAAGRIGIAPPPARARLQPELKRMTGSRRLDDLDPVETQEWLESIESILNTHGPERARFLLERLSHYMRHIGAYRPLRPNTAYVNTIPAGGEPEYPGNSSLERRIEAFVRWNALTMVAQANLTSLEYGGHLSSYASSATLYEVGFNHFWRAPTEQHPGDMVFMQAHSSPGIYARAYLEGRLTEDHLRHFRREAGGPGTGLSSYPHPWLMPDFWQFPTVSMGLGPMMAIAQARFVRYLEHRGVVKPSDRKVWALLGDGEMDEPEAMGALTLPVRDGLDNLIFVINCNLQRLDGPVRGNGKIIQELEAAFLGAGWNVIKVIWGSRWDPLFAQDHHGLLRRAMEECLDGEYQNFKAKGGAYTREHFFGRYPELEALVANMTDEEIWSLNRGGHDPRKVYAAYAAALRHERQPTVILAKTVKGFGLGKGAEGQMTAHQQKKLSEEDLRAFRDRFDIPVTDEDIAQLPFRKPDEDSAEARYLRERRRSLGGYLPARRNFAPPLQIPTIDAFAPLLEGTGKREISTTMAFVRILTILLKDRNIGKNIVPIVPDEARTFGMEGLFRQIGIYSSVGQLYVPQDAQTLMSYREDKKGQMIEEGINEAGALCSWIAAGTAYSNHGINMVPFYIFYSMFGFQRVGDFIWAAADIQARGFLLGATAGRTTLAGEGLQHQDGHSQLVATTVPNCVAYDPAYAYELAVIIREGLHRMFSMQENIFYYITLMNENYAQPALPEGVTEGILKGAYLLQSGRAALLKVNLLGSGAILGECLAAAKILENDYGVSVDVYSVTSFSELRREAVECERWSLLHPKAERRVPYVQKCFMGRGCPFIAVTDYVRMVPEQIRQWIDGRYVTLGTDGFGRSDSRASLRKYFEVDRQYITVSALKALADNGKIDRDTVTDAMHALGIDAAKPVPWNH